MTSSYQIARCSLMFELFIFKKVKLYWFVFIFYFLQNKESTFWLWKSSTDHVWEKTISILVGISILVLVILLQLYLNSRDLTFEGRFVYLVVVEVVVIAVIVLKFGPQFDVVLWWTRVRFLCFKSPLTV